MCETHELHRPLQSGIKITSRTGSPLSTTLIGGGTLTCLARRNDGTKVLVTNSHVIAGLDENGFLRNPTGTELMFQGGDSFAHKVGTVVDWEDFTLGKQNPNEVDLAICTLDENIDPWGGDTLGASYRLHDSPHSDRSIIVGTMNPSPGMEVIILGGYTGEISGHVFDINRGQTEDTLDPIGGVYFENLSLEVVLTCTK